ncbi:dienelactone hydrolase family protein [Zobellella maritima]|uniref:dienelactone hydrolase family protein n=1 Tax=Zobellella maritima TaxID=2059725 RepID=UPI000E307BD2|nr:alpha/beta family hydrolase [Zobellella maritima]
MSSAVVHREVRFKAAGVVLDGFLALPHQSRALVLFAHGSGSSRFSPRNRLVAERLNEAGIGTLLFDLLTADENLIDEVTREFRFNIPLLARRLSGAIDWAGGETDTRALRLGLFGSSTGAAAALLAAADRPQRVAAVVSRGGRPDLAGPALSKVQASTLLIVGGEDHQVLTLNREAAQQMTAMFRLETVPGASHLFEEPGTLDAVIRLAIDWFDRYLHED